MSTGNSGSPASGPQAFRCPHCGARRITGAEAPCWLCRQPLPAYHGPMPGPVAEPRRDSPTLIFLGVLVILVGLAFTIEAPGMGVALLVLATPALIRAVVASSRTRAAGRPLTGAEKVGVFFSSLGVVAAVGVAAGAAFFAACFAICLGFVALDAVSGPSGNIVLGVSVGAGLLVGIQLFVFLLYKFWPRKV